MNGPCFNGGPNCGTLDCAWGCAGSAKLAVPTGSVPRADRLAAGVLYANPRAELERSLLQPDPPPGPMKGLSNLHINPATLHRECATMPPAERCDECHPVDPIQRAVDDYLLMERKARAWGELVERARDWASVEVTLEELERAVHPAQPSAPATR